MLVMIIDMGEEQGRGGGRRSFYRENHITNPAVLDMVQYLFEYKLLLPQRS